MKLIVSTFLVYKVKKCLQKSGKVKITIFPKNMEIFPIMPLFSQETPDFSQKQQIFGKSVGKGLQENEGIFLPFC